MRNIVLKAYRLGLSPLLICWYLLSILLPTVNVINKWFSIHQNICSNMHNYKYLVVGIVALNFDKVFTIFHKVLFANNYWKQSSESDLIQLAATVVFEANGAHMWHLLCYSFGCCGYGVETATSKLVESLCSISCWTASANWFVVCGWRWLQQRSLLYISLYRASWSTVLPISSCPVELSYPYSNLKASSK